MIFFFFKKTGLPWACQYFKKVQIYSIYMCVGDEGGSIINWYMLMEPWLYRFLWVGKDVRAGFT